MSYRKYERDGFRTQSGKVEFYSLAPEITSMELPYDPAMGTYQLRALLCRIAKADAAAA